MGHAYRCWLGQPRARVREESAQRWVHDRGTPGETVAHRVGDKAVHTAGDQAPGRVVGEGGAAATHRELIHGIGEQQGRDQQRGGIQPPFIFIQYTSLLY